jgi:hypothetical protein
MYKRFTRVGLLALGAVLFYVAIVNPSLMKFIYPQVQISLVGLAKMIISACVGFIVGFALYPHKINWDKPPNTVGIGAYARTLTVLLFIYLGYTYA